MQEIQFLRAKIQDMPQGSSGSSVSFGWLTGFIASVGLAGSVGVAAVRKYAGHGQQGSEYTEGSQISLVPQRAYRAPSPQMKTSEIVLADKALETKIMSV